MRRASTANAKDAASRTLSGSPFLRSSSGALTPRFSGRIIVAEGVYFSLPPFPSVMMDIGFIIISSLFILLNFFKSLSNIVKSPFEHVQIIR